MTLPKNAKEHREQFEENTTRENVGGNTMVRCACPFCAAAKFTDLEIEKPTQELRVTHAGCDECRRGASLVWSVKQGTISAEITRISGDEPPKWFKDKNRKFTI